MLAADPETETLLGPQEGVAPPSSQPASAPAAEPEPALDEKKLASLIANNATGDEIRAFAAQAGFDAEPLVQRIFEDQITRSVRDGRHPAYLMRVGAQYGYDAMPIVERVAGDRGLLGELKGRAARGALQAEQAYNLLGALAGVDTSERMASTNAALRAIPLTKGEKAWDEAEGVLGAAWAAMKHPLDVVGGVTLESLTAQLGSVPAALPGAAAGAGAGALIGGIGAGPGAVIGLAGTSSLLLEVAGEVQSELARKGVNILDAKALRTALADPQTRNSVLGIAAAKGLPVAALDALSAGIAGRLAGQGFKALAREVGEQAALGMAGEAAGQLAQSAAAGESRFDPKGIALEGIAEIGGAAPEIATGRAMRGAPVSAQEQDEAAGVLTGAGAPTTPPVAEVSPEVSSQPEIAVQAVQELSGATEAAPVEQAPAAPMDATKDAPRTQADAVTEGAAETYESASAEEGRPTDAQTDAPALAFARTVAAESGADVAVAEDAAQVTQQIAPDKPTVLVVPTARAQAMLRTLGSFFEVKRHARVEGQDVIVLAPGRTEQMPALERPDPATISAPEVKPAAPLNGGAARKVEGQTSTPSGPQVMGRPSAAVHAGTTIPADQPATRVPRPQGEPATVEAQPLIAMQRPAVREAERRALSPEQKAEAQAIVRDLMRGLGVGAVTRSRRSAPKGQEASYEAVVGDVRARNVSAVSAIVHEAGHALHERLFPRRGSGRRTLSAADFPASWRSELEAEGRALYGAKQPTGGYESEGWAEFVRLLVSKPAEAEKRLPTVYNEATRELKQRHPKVWTVLEDTARRTRTLLEGHEKNPVQGWVARDRKQPKQPAIDAYDAFRARWTDRYARIKTLVNDLGPPPSVERDPYRLALRQTGHASGDMALAMDSGRFDPKDSLRRRTGESLSEILRWLFDNKLVDLWEDYMIARRTLEKRAQGYVVLPGDSLLGASTSNAELEAFIKRTEAEHPEFADIASRFQAFNRWFIQDYLVGMELLTAEQAEAIVKKNLEYITFRTLEDAPSAKAKGSSKRMSGRGAGIRRFSDSSGEPLVSPIRSFMEQMQRAMQSAHANRTLQAITDYYENGAPGAARWMTKEDVPIQATRVQAEDIRKEVQQQLGFTYDRRTGLPQWKGQRPQWAADLTDQQVADMGEALATVKAATFFSPSQRVDKNSGQVMVLRQGKPEFYQVGKKDRLLFEAIEAIDFHALDGMFRLLTYPARMLRAGATGRNPLFGVANFQRDFMQSLVLTDSDLSKLSAQKRARLRGMREAFLGGDIERLFSASGASMSTLFGEYYDPGTQRLDMARMFAKPRKLGLVKGSTPAEIAKDALTLGAVARMNEAIERSTRYAEYILAYEAARGRGMSESEAHLHAGQASADLMDFQRGGTWAKRINEVVPFFNAGIQGTNRLAREIAKNPVRAGARVTALLVAPSIALMLAHRDDEDYWNIPYEQRDRYWYFPAGTREDGKPRYVKVSKPYGLGLFSIAAERAMSFAMGRDPLTGKPGGDPRAFEGSARSAVQQLSPIDGVSALLPTAIQPLLEVLIGAEGYDFFRGRSIVRAQDRDLPAKLQGASHSSDLANALGEFLHYPPAKLDHLISGYLAGVGKAGVALVADPLVRAATGKDKRASAPEAGVVSRFLATEPRASHEAIRRFYDDLTDLRRIGKHAKALSGVEQADFKARNRAKLDLLRAYEATARKVSDRLREARDISSGKKEVPKADIDRQISQSYRDAVDAIRRTFAPAPIEGTSP